MDLLTVWRLAYELPPTDERYLAITEEEAAYDLLVRQFYQARKEDAKEEPAWEWIDELQSSVDAFHRAEAEAREHLASPEQKRAIERALHGGTPEELEDRSRPVAIRLAGRIASTKPVRP
jgi:hypothetical protein